MVKKGSLKGKSVLVLLSNPATYDMRPLKEALALVKNGCRITILAWDRERSSYRQSSSKNFLVRRFNLKAPYGQNLKTVIGFILFYVWCIISSLSFNFQVVHCHDVDTLFCGIVIKMARLKRIKLIYDMHDHPIAFLNKFPMSNFLVKIVFAMGKRYVDHIIVVNEGFVDYLSKIGFEKEKITVIMNVSPRVMYKSYNIATRDKGRFTIFYYGDMVAQRGVDKLIKAIIDLKDVELLLAGKGDLVPMIKNVEKECNNIKYLGWISPSEIDVMLKQADLVPSLYVPNNINHILASPGKLFTAMAHGIPVLVPDGSYQAKIVREYNCGIVVNINNVEEIRNAIMNLASHPSLCRKLGQNGSKAVDEVFNWETMEQRLVKLYCSLVS